MRTALRLPPPLPNDAPAADLDASDEDGDDLVDDSNDGYIHQDFLTPDEQLRLEAMQSIDNGATRASWAERLGVTPTRVGQLHRAWHRPGSKGGSRALRRYGTRESGGSDLHPDIKDIAKRLLKDVPTMPVRDVRDHPDIRAACDLIYGELPLIKRFKTLVFELAEENLAIGRIPTSRAIPTRSEASGYTAFWNRPGFLEHDEWTTNLAAQLMPGLPFTRRPHGMLAKDIASKVPAGHVVSTQTMDQNDLRLLLLRVIRPKDHLVKRSKAKHPWPIAILPFMLRGDNAWINYAAMFLLTPCELGILIEFAPAKQPQRKPVAESGIGQVQKISEDRQPNSTQRDPRLRGKSKPEVYAAKHAISGLKVENDLTKTLVDGVLWAWDKRAGATPMTKWNHLVERFGVRTYDGPQGDLVRRFKRPVGARRYGTHGISHKGRDYVCTWGGDRDIDPRNDLPYPSPRHRFVKGKALLLVFDDPDDVRMVDVCTLDGTYRGTLVANIISAEYGRAVSQFELDVRAKLDEDEKRAGIASREESTAETRHANQALPAVQVAKDLAHIDQINRRHAETLGVVPKPKPRAKTAPPPKQTQNPVASTRTTLARRGGTYATPAIRPAPARVALIHSDSRPFTRSGARSTRGTDD